MANRNATFAKRQRETDLKDRAKAKEERRAQKRGEVRENKGPQIAWGEAVHAVTDDENENDAPSLGAGDDDTRHSASDADRPDRPDRPDRSDAPAPAPGSAPAPSAGPRRPANS